MSSEAGNKFGEEYADEYAKFLRRWDEKLDGKEYSDELANEFGNDLREALGAPMAAAAAGETAIVLSGLTLEPNDGQTVNHWANIAVLSAIVLGSADLLRRMIKTKESEKACGNQFATCPPKSTVNQAILRAKQTVAQIYDMVKDKINELALRFFTKRGDLTGRRRWVADGKNSRHAKLNGQIRNQNARFNYRGDKIDGPRPKDGKPEHWSNCSCRLQVERKRGGRLEWVDL